jgi:hypothetical protein
LESDSTNNNSARASTDINFHLPDTEEHADTSLNNNQPDATTRNYAEQLNNQGDEQRPNNADQEALKSDTNNNSRKENLDADASIQLNNINNLAELNRNEAMEVNNGLESVTDKLRSLSDSTTSDSTVSCYLCIKVNKNKDFISCPLNRKMKNRLKSEFWFQINDSR